MKDNLVNPQEVAKLKAMGEEVVLVCAYDDETNYERIGIPGSVSYPAFQRQGPANGGAVVFYCDCAHDELAKEKTEAYRRQGVNALALDGGVNAWAKAGM